MNGLKAFSLLAASVATISCGSRALPPDAQDTPDNRRRAAEHYLEIVPPAALLRDMAEQLAPSVPETQRAAFIRAMTQDLDVPKISNAMVKGMVNRFTVAEINALTEFYSSGEGKSVMKKYGLYMADIMPVIQAEVMKAVNAVQTTR